MIKVKCQKCDGAGKIRQYLHISDGFCFACNGKGHKMVRKAPSPKVSISWVDKDYPGYTERKNQSKQS